eukprot:CAMPEP_0172473156 /NCGR_PEP_ID=MMETSP1065-20121228/68711_1 /TAXON_ID=265537 /ORGANISM="Amphiprora paludosa, Strain CCMP125" /LENGTH=961 /DNA_ID=CAMNT_0013231325 /DNA_START=177 /DNA_END=3062 /DNA_ORIENTATION=+
MGLLKVGTPKSWDDSKKNLKYIRQAGVKQFISTYNRVKDLKGDELLWGDEIEYGIFHIDKANKKLRLSLRGAEIMNALNKQESLYTSENEVTFVPEYGAWMCEATPARPYTGYTADLLRVETSMRLRRQRMLTVLKDYEIAPTVSTYPMLGAQGDDGSVPPTKVGGPRTQSDYISDDIINPHPRFGTLTANIRQRRGSKVNIRVPLFRDVNTPEYANYEPLHGGVDGCCGSDAQQLWRYGKGDFCAEKFGNRKILVGCSKSSLDEEFDEHHSNTDRLQKWLVDVQCAGCEGLFYRRVPGEIVADADWPRNGDVVVGYELQDQPGWVRLQNGYYLPIYSDDGNIPFLHRVSSRAVTSNTELKRIGSNAPLFRMGDAGDSKEALSSLLDGNIKVASAGSTASSPVSMEAAAATLTKPPPTEEEECSSLVEEAGSDSLRAAIHMDAMAFGMGCCCLQVTFQGKDIDESRFMYDQLAVMAPILMALTASTPILKGRLADTDARWGVISESVDCRTPAERGRNDPNAPHPELNAQGRRRIYKSRYDSISTYIYQAVISPENNASSLKSKQLSNRLLNRYNDIIVPFDEEVFKQCREAGVDPALAQHIAHLFIRDPLVIFEGAVEEVDDEKQTEHFESIQSTNWQTVRWKPPPPRNDPNDPHIGWRTEFRSMEIQLTDYENSAFTVFIILLTRVILAFDLNLYIPISRVDANMQRAHSRNAAHKGKFFFRRHMAPLEIGDVGYGVKYVSMFSRANGKNGSANSSVTSPDDTSSNNDDEGLDGVSMNRLTAPCATGSDEGNSFEEMTMAEIMSGKGDYFPGLIPLISAYLDYIQVDKATKAKLSSYLEFIEKRANGELVTPATWMRNYVRSHPAYKGDSVVTDEIAYDLMIACKEIGEGKLHVPELLGNVHIDPITPEGAYDAKLGSNRARNDQVLELLRRYTGRRAFGTSESVTTAVTEEETTAETA